MANTLRHIPERLQEIDRLWPQYVVSPQDLDRCSLADAGKACGPGVYFLWGADDWLLYVGMTVDFSHRLYHHQRKDAIPVQAFSFLPVAPHDFCNMAQWVEGAYIDALQPPFNVKPGECGFAGRLKMMAKIKAAWDACLYDPYLDRMA